MSIYSNDKAKEISFPLGGIGCGGIGLAGNGHLIDWEISNHPDKGRYNGYSHFAIKAERAGHVVDARLLHCLLYTSPSPRDRQKSRMPSSA